MALPVPTTVGILGGERGTRAALRQPHAPSLTKRGIGWTAFPYRNGWPNSGGEVEVVRREGGPAGESIYRGVRAGSVEGATWRPMCSELGGSGRPRLFLRGWLENECRRLGVTQILPPEELLLIDPNHGDRQPVQPVGAT